MKIFMSDPKSLFIDFARSGARWFQTCVWGHTPTRVTALMLCLLPFAGMLAYGVILPAVARQERHDPGSSGVNRMLDSLQTHDAFLRSQLKLGRSDSISLVINLRDSIAVLTARGVPVKRCPVLSYRTSPGVDLIMRSGMTASWIRTPFVLTGESASIEKIPVRIKYAPKDTNEAEKQADEPEPLEKQDVYVAMSFDRSLGFRISQAEPPSLKYLGDDIRHFLRLSLRELGRTLNSAIHLRLPRDECRIEIRVSRDDATAIYRATPDSLRIALRP